MVLKLANKILWKVIKTNLQKENEEQLTYRSECERVFQLERITGQAQCNAVCSVQFDGAIHEKDFAQTERQT